MEIDTAYAEIAIATASPKFWRNAQTIKAITSEFDGRGILGAEVVSNHHSVTFEGLEGDTIYAYRVGVGKRWSEWVQFRTASKDPNSTFTFLYMGDAQNFILELWSRPIRQAYKKAPEARFIVLAVA